MGRGNTIIEWRPNGESISRPHKLWGFTEAFATDVLRTQLGERRKYPRPMWGWWRMVYSARGMVLEIRAARARAAAAAALLGVLLLGACAPKPGDACSGEPVMGVWQRGSCGAGQVCARGACATSCELWIFHEGYDAGGEASPFYPDGGVDPARLEMHNAPCVAALGEGASCDGLGACVQ